MTLFDDTMDYISKGEYEDAGITFGQMLKEELDKFDLIVEREDMEIFFEGLEGELLP